MAIDLKEKKNVISLDAPVSGGRRAARTGDLTILVGGDSEGIEHCKPIFETYSKK